MGYFSASRHAWCCFLFLLPLILLYEGGVIYYSRTDSPILRNGADAWIRWGLETVGVHQFLAAPALLLAFLFLWTLRHWESRPQHPFSTVFGMTLESLIYSYGLWSISRNYSLLLDKFGIHIPAAFPLPQEVSSQVITYIGAGIYEEVLFRFILFAGLVFLFRFAFIPSLLAIPISGIISSLLFAGAHHLGPFGEPFQAYVFSFRVTAGLYFCLVFWLRGFGIAVGTHAAYDLFVGIDWHS